MLTSSIVFIHIPSIARAGIVRHGALFHVFVPQPALVTAIAKKIPEKNIGAL
ncbi:hypothetical protein [Herbaspirillum seropedicae]|uniref:hypothetical protein n=1 Tax=Herbaspirillum seropedicae TaxID=964 RepID=UPI003FCD9B31